jgi:prepilin-type N-terminal cleavage/methylation domain-containing protein
MILRKHGGARGFTLLELSIVLTLICVIVAVGVAVMTAGLQASEFNATITRMDAVEKAILSYAVANNRIPCPTDLTLTTSSANYGFEAGAGSGSAIATATGVCTGTGMLPQANFKATSGTVEGGVPTRALRLSDDYMYDGWGRKFRYAVDPTYTAASALPITASCGAGFTPDASAITVNDSTGAARTTAGMYVLISHGANGHGAYTSNGVVLNAGSVNANELTNCHCTSAAVPGTYTPTYFEMAPTTDSTNALDNFDDIVTFKEPWQMQALNFPLTATCPQYFYLVTGAWSPGYDVQQFTLTGTYVTQFAPGGTGSQNVEGAWDAAVDSGGTVWVGDTNNGRLQKYSSTGNYVGQVSSYGCGGGLMRNPEGLAFDGSGNLWVVDNICDYVWEFSGSGTYIKSLGGPGTGQGQFTYPVSIAFDSGGNIYVADTSNQRVQEFNSSGTFVQQLGCSGTSACPGGTIQGLFQNPEFVAVDKSGNIWVTDTLNNRVQEFNSSGTFVQQLGCSGTNACSNGSGNGQFYNPAGITIDPSGNIWVSDFYNNRIEEFSSSGTYLNQFLSNGSVHIQGIAISSR